MNKVGFLEHASCAAATAYRDPFTTLNDPTLLLALKSQGPQSRRAFNRFMQGALPLLRARISKAFTDPDEAEEVLSETLMALANGVKTFRGEARLTTWMYGILQNKVCDHISRLQRRRKLNEELTQESSHSGDLMGENSPTYWDSSPEKICDHLRLKAWIHDSLSQLSPSDSEAWILREINGLTTDEAAEKVGISGEAFRVRLFRARQRLAILVKARFHGVQVMSNDSGRNQNETRPLLKVA